MTSSLRRLIPGTELSVFPLNLGTNVFGWTADEPTSHAVLDAFVEAGGNFLDTADSYPAWVPGNSGHESETFIGNWMKARKNREQIVVATKTGDHPAKRSQKPADILAAAEGSLKRLQTDRIDLYYAHRDDNVTPIEEQARAYDQLVKAGKVRHIAISNYTPERIRQWFEIARAENLTLPVALQPHYSLVFRRELETKVAPLAKEYKLAVFPYFSLAAGFLTGKYRTLADLEGAARGGMAKGYLNETGLKVVDTLAEVAKAHDAALATVALAWLLAKESVTAPIASVRNTEQLPPLVAAPHLRLSDAEVKALDEASAPFA